MDSLLKQTFRHLPGIGPTSELFLWEAGIGSWDDVLEHHGRLPGRFSALPGAIEESFERLEQRDSSWFLGRLPASESWRLWFDFRSEIAYVDIETDGLSHTRGGAITTICLWDGERLSTYVNGENLRDFIDDVHDHKLVVTYNGSSFDLPFIASWFNEPIMTGHLDIRHPLAAHGYKGGLKGCERQLGIERGDLDQVDGEYAVLLWRRYVADGRPEVLSTLLAYNALDVINLEALSARLHNRLVGEYSFDRRLIVNEESASVELPTIDRDVVLETRRQIESRQASIRDMAREILGNRS